MREKQKSDPGGMQAQTAIVTAKQIFELYRNFFAKNCIVLEKQGFGVLKHQNITKQFCP